MELAQRSGMSTSHILNTENGTSALTAESRQKIEAVLTREAQENDWRPDEVPFSREELQKASLWVLEGVRAHGGHASWNQIRRYLTEERDRGRLKCLHAIVNHKLDIGKHLIKRRFIHPFDQDLNWSWTASGKRYVNEQQPKEG